MIARILVACLGLAPVLQAQVVSKVNPPIAGDVSRFTWTPDGRYVLYGAPGSTPGIEAVTSHRVSDGSEVVYDPYAGRWYFSAAVDGFVFLPDAELAGARFSTTDGISFPPVYGSPLHILERATASLVTITGAQSPQFLADGRMLSRTSYTAFRGSIYERAWSGRWDADVPAVELSPPEQPDNHVSLVLPALHAGVAVFGWRDTFWSANNAELLAVPIDGGVPVPLTPPPAASQRTGVDAVHVRSSDELVVYLADEATSGLVELWAVPVDGSLAPRRLSPPLVPGRYISNPTVSSDEARVVFVCDANAYQVHELWSADIDNGTTQLLSGPMTSGGDVGSYDFWISPDGGRVVYLADQRADEVFELYSAPIDGSAPAVRLHPPLPASADALQTVYFTPDGGTVVFAIRMTNGVVLLAAPTDASTAPVALNQPFPNGGGVQVLSPSSGIFSTVAIAPGGRHVFFLGKQDSASVVELYSAPIDGSAPPHKWNAPLVAGGNVTAFALRPGPGAALYRADAEVDEHFELYLSAVPDAPPPHAAASAPTRTVTVTAPPF